MKRNFVVGLLGSLIGLAMVLLSAAGVVGAPAIQSQPAVARTQEVSAATPLTSTFTYQGQLKQGHSPVTGSCQMAFRLYDDPSASTHPIGSPLTTTVSINHGLFTVGLNFGSSVFDGNGRWLDIQVNCGSGFVTLTPRQALTPAPYALALPGLYTQQNATSPNVIGGYAGNVISPTVVGGVIGGGGANGVPNRVWANYATIGGGGNNVASVNNATIGGGWYNTASGFAATIGGGESNIASSVDATVGGGWHNTANNSNTTVSGGTTNTASGSNATVGGGGSNTASGNSATIGGGEGNTASGNKATVSGGEGNAVSNNHATVAGGWVNTASGEWATVGGGQDNTASGDNTTISGGKSNYANGERATISGGGSNVADGFTATVGGGEGNLAGGSYSTVPGGFHNAAMMTYTLAAGRQAKAIHDGAFVWADSTSADFTSTANNQFLMRANGGVGINTNQPRTTLEIAKSNSASLGGTLRLSNPAGGSNAQVALDFATTDVLTNAPSARILATDVGNYSADLLFQTKIPGALGNALQTNMKVRTNGYIAIEYLSTGGSTTLCRNASNDIATCSSSLRYKSNVANLPLGLDAITQLRPVTFDWKDSGQADLGFVAEEVQQLMPLLTTLNAQGQIEGVKYDRITAVLVKGMQEQQQQISAQQNEIRDLQARLADRDPNAPAASFNAFNLTSIIALLGLVVLWGQQRRSRAGGGAR